MGVVGAREFIYRQVLVRVRGVVVNWPRTKQTEIGVEQLQTCGCRTAEARRRLGPAADVVVGITKTASYT
jgi:hypothetical protein